MGHVRLGDLPRTRRWQQVVGLIAGGAGTVQLANATISAAEQGLNLAARDKGLVETIWLFMQLPTAARSDNFAAALRQTGMEVSDSPSLMEVVGAFSDAVDRRLGNNEGRTDLGEMAEMAAAETLSKVMGERTRSLFGTTHDDVRREFSKLATSEKQFSGVARDFFSRLTNKCMGYFLSRAMACHVGEGRRFSTLAQQSEFSRALETHCREASKIVEQFSGEWYSKTKYQQGGVSRDEAGKFAYGAMRKLVAELKEGARSDVE